MSNPLTFAYIYSREMIEVFSYLTITLVLAIWGTLLSFKLCVIITLLGV